MLRTRIAGLIVALFMLGIFLAPVGANVVTSATMAELISGAKSLGWYAPGPKLENTPIGNVLKVAENWGGWSNTGKLVDPASITVRAQWDSPGVICVYYQNGLRVDANEGLDIFWSYDLTDLTGPSLKDACMELWTYNVHGAGEISWAETLRDKGGNLITTLGVTEDRPKDCINDWRDPIEMALRTPGVPHAAVDYIFVTKDLHMKGGQGGDAFLSDWKQCYSQVVPEASTLLFFGLGVLGAFGLRRRNPR